jgi:hypothetical protein
MLHRGTLALLCILGGCFDPAPGELRFNLDYGGNSASLVDACDLWVHTGDFIQATNMLVQSNSKRTAAGHYIKLRLYQTPVAFPGTYELANDAVEAEFCDFDRCRDFTYGSIVVEQVVWDPDGHVVGTFDVTRIAGDGIPPLRAVGEMSCEVTLWF